MKFIFNLLLICFTGVYCSSQEFIEIESNNTSFKFPKLKYDEAPNIEEKVNSFLQLKYLLHLPGIYKNNPFEKILNKDIVSNDYEFTNWEQIKFNNTIISIRIDQTINGKSIRSVENFDARTGDFFGLYGLFNDEGKEKLHQEISSKINVFVDEGKVESYEYNVPISYKLTENKLIFIFNELKDEQIALPYSELKPFFTKYAINLLFPSDKIIRRPDMSNKLLKGEGILSKGTKYERKLNYSILIFDIEENTGKAKIYRWKDSLKKAEKYTESYIKDNTINGDDYLWDSLANEKAHAMYSLKLKKINEGIWEGTIQLGSGVYPLIFKEN